MSSSSPKTTPLAPYYKSGSEEDEDSDDKVPEVRPAANVARKVSRRDEASDSGYSSHTVATGSSSQSSKPKSESPKAGIMKAFGKKVAGTSKKSASKEPPTPPHPKPLRRKSINRTHGMEDLRRALEDEGREEAARMRPTGPVRAKTTAPPSQPPRREPVSPTATRPPPAQAIPIHHYKPQVYHTGRPRPQSYHGPLPVIYTQHPQLVQQVHPDPRALQQPMHMLYQQPLPQPPPPPQQQPQQQQVQYTIVATSPTSPNRPINYNFPPTQFASANSYFPPQAAQQLYQQGRQYHPNPQHMRRMSMPRSTVEYPPVPQPSRPAAPEVHYAAAQIHYAEPTSRPASIGPTRYVVRRSPIEEHSPLDEEMFYSDDRSFHAEDHRQAAIDMPPPARPGYPRAATTTLTHTASARRTSRNSFEYLAQSPLKTSMESSRPPSRPGISSRTSHSSGGSSRNHPPMEAPTSPTNLRPRQSRPMSTDYSKQHHDLRYDEAEAYQHEQTGHNARVDLTTDRVQKALRQKQSRTQTAKSGRSETPSHTSSKSSDPKKTKRRERREDDNITVKMGKLQLSMKGGKGNIAIKQSDHGSVEVRVGGHTKSRPGDGATRQIKDRERSMQYLGTGGSNKGEVEVNRTDRMRSRSRKPATRRYDSEGPPSVRLGSAGPGSAASDRKEPKEKDILQRLRTEGEITPRSRRSSRSAPRKPATEDAAEAAAKAAATGDPF